MVCTVASQQEVSGLNSKVWWACGVCLFSPCLSGCSGFTPRYQNIHWGNILSLRSDAAKQHPRAQMRTMGQTQRRNFTLSNVFVTCIVDCVLSECFMTANHLILFPWVFDDSAFHWMLSPFSCHCPLNNGWWRLLTLISACWAPAPAQSTKSSDGICSPQIPPPHLEEVKTTYYWILNCATCFPVLFFCCVTPCQLHSNNSRAGMCCRVHSGSHLTTWRKDKKSCGGPYVCVGEIINGRGGSHWPRPLVPLRPLLRGSTVSAIVQQQSR